MIRITYAAAAALAVAGAAIWIPTSHALAKNGTQPAMITFRDAPTDAMKSDGLGPYMNNVSGASVFFQTGGNVELDLSASSRTLNLDFSMPDTALNQSLGLNPNPALYSGPKHATITQGVLNANGTCCSSNGLLGIPSGQAAQSFLAINFSDANGTACHLVFGKPAPGYQNTTDATVVRNSDIAWTLTTFATDVALLTCNGKGNVVTIEGYFYLPTQFAIATM